MSDTTEPSSESPVSASGEPNSSRRRLLQGGLATAPVLMTLISRPVLAQRGEGPCQTPSGFVSANASTAGRTVTCSGRPSTAWKNVPAFLWPPPFQPGTLFNSVFNNPPYPPFAGKTLLDILSLDGTAPINDVARTIVAALLNAASGRTPVLTVQVIKHMWSEYSTTGFGFFSPSSGARWDHDELMDYLRITQPSS